MALLTQAPRGTQDILPDVSAKWQYIERVVLECAAAFGFSEIRVPTFEHTELFQRSVGDTTDVVQKEMYTFTDKGNRSVTLRPEGTAGVMRAILQNGILGNTAMPIKVSYLANCFRYETPQAGRYREFHQFGIEMTGSAEPAADAQVIAVAQSIFDRLGIQNIDLQLNSIGCPECRPNYHAALKAYFAARESELCETCKDRLTRNPMRILDCKSPVCAEIAKGAPVVLDYICDDCKTHFETTQQFLAAHGISFRINPTIVRGLDYYTRTVFEFVATGIGAQGTVCGGGRYDGLIEMLGGAPTPSIGFAMGLERLLLVMEQQGCPFPEESPCMIYVGARGDMQPQLKAAEICAAVRKEGFYAEEDTMNRSVKAQMKYANKLGARFSCIIGDDEIANGEVAVKNMQDGETATVKLTAQAIVDFLYGQMHRQIGDSAQGIL